MPAPEKFSYRHLSCLHGSVNHPAGVSLRTSGSQRLPAIQTRSHAFVSLRTSRACGSHTFRHNCLALSLFVTPQAGTPTLTLRRASCSVRLQALRPSLRSGPRSCRRTRETSASLKPKSKCHACFPSHAHKPSADALRFFRTPPCLAAHLRSHHAASLRSAVLVSSDSR